MQCSGTAWEWNFQTSYLEDSLLCIERSQWNVLHDVDLVRVDCQLTCDHSCHESLVSQSCLYHAIVSPLLLPNIWKMRRPADTCGGQEC